MTPLLVGIDIGSTTVVGELPRGALARLGIFVGPSLVRGSIEALILADVVLLAGAEARGRARRPASVESQVQAALAAGLRSCKLPDMDDLAALAAPHYSPALRGGSGHLEVGAYLAAARDGSADLIVSVKPFTCTSSSAISDGIMPSLARASSVGF